MKFFLLVSVFVASCYANATELSRWLNVVGIQEGHEEEIAADQRWLFENTIIDSSAFSVTLTPEGDPVFDKAKAYLPRLMKMKGLMGEGRFGLMFQATMGHGWVPNSKTPWQKVIASDGSEKYIFCPLGEEFRNYIKNQVETLSQVRPDYFMVDDDTRLITGRDGCFCPLHLKEMERQTGKKWSRADLVASLKTDLKLARIYDRVLEDSIMGLVNIIRDGMGNPEMPGMFCCTVSDARHASRIARAVAAKGQRPVVRLNNGRYCQETARNIPDWLHKTAIQLASIDEDIIVLAEPDTCPQNRYSMSARDLNCHIVMSLLEGCKGAKIWITRNVQWEVESGLAYRKILSRYKGFYEAIEKLSVTWSGVKVPLPKEPYFSLKTQKSFSNWGGAILGRMGIAYANTKAESNIAALSGGDIKLLSDDDIKGLLSKKLIVDGAGAMALVKRGFAKEIGCKIEKWDGKIASYEVILENKRPIMTKPNPVKITNLSPKAEILSMYYHRVSGLTKEALPLTPGAIRFCNELGGEILVLANCLPAGVGLGAPFSFYNQTFKTQLIEYLCKLGYDSPYYPMDAEILLKWGVCKAGDRILAVLDTGHDSLDELPLILPNGSKPSKIERLGDNGNWEDVKFKNVENKIILDTKIHFIEPAIFRFRL